VRRREIKNLGGFTIVLISLLILTYYAAADAASPLDVVINEVAWMGTQASTADEWIELKNNTDLGIDLTNWILSWRDGTVTITLSGTIPANGYYLLEKTDDHAVNNIPADLIYHIGSYGLQDAGEKLELKDADGIVINTANGNGGPWPAGDKDSRSSMERINPSAEDSDSNWSTNDGIMRNGKDVADNPINGTPKARNSATNSPPTANVGPDQTVQTGDKVQLDGSGSSDPDGDSLSYSWSFTSKPAGSAAVLSDPSIVNPTFVPDAVGDYVLELVVEDDYGGSDTDQVTITAHAPPIAAFTYVPDHPTTWDAIQFTDQSSDSDGTVVAWVWNFGDGGSSNEQNPTHRYRLPGTYPVTLEVTDNDGLNGTTVREVEVALGLGDVDGSGTVDVLDVRIVMQAALGIVALTPEQARAADVDEDGDVDRTDAEILAEYVIGL